MSLINTCSLVNLVSLRREILVSRLALVRVGSTVFPLHLMLHMYASVCAVTHTRGISKSGSHSNSNLSNLSGVTSESNLANSSTDYLAIEYGWMETCDLLIVMSIEYHHFISFNNFYTIFR